MDFVVLHESVAARRPCRPDCRNANAVIVQDAGGCELQVGHGCDRLEGRQRRVVVDDGGLFCAPVERSRAGLTQRQRDPQVACISRAKRPAYNLKLFLVPAVARISQGDDLAHFHIKGVEAEVSRDGHLLAATEQRQLGKSLRAGGTGGERQGKVKQRLLAAVFCLKRGTGDRRIVSGNPPLRRIVKRALHAIELILQVHPRGQVDRPAQVVQRQHLGGRNVIADLQLPLASAPEQRASAGSHHALQDIAVALIGLRYAVDGVTLFTAPSGKAHVFVADVGSGGEVHLVNLIVV